MSLIGPAMVSNDSYYGTASSPDIPMKGPPTLTGSTRRQGQSDHREQSQCAADQRRWLGYSHAHDASPISQVIFDSCRVYARDQVQIRVINLSAEETQRSVREVDVKQPAVRPAVGVE